MDAKINLGRIAFRPRDIRDSWKWFITLPFTGRRAMSKGVTPEAWAKHQSLLKAAS
jgi:hypothetical protein